ncbi:MAG: DHH family phosphoesterase [Candidatus Marinimicrobia bacterium]|nr:DHH family phosphoesterase [Candidatus Neomarinimicrobiota bacterium]
METEEIKTENIITEDIKKKFLEKLKKLKKDNRIALVTHKTPEADADALATAFALQYLFFQLSCESDIFGSVNHSHPQNKTMVNKLQIDLKSRDFFEENKKNYKLIVFCDTNKGNAFLDVDPDIIVDHHTENEIVENCIDIREKTGAASTIAFLLLEALETEPSSEVATALAIGIASDTKDLTREDETTDMDIEAHKALLQKSDYSLFARINGGYDIPRQLIKLMGEGFHNACFGEYEAIIGLGETKQAQDHYYAVIADFVFRVPGTQLVVVIGVEEGKAIRASIRTNSDLIQINDFCKKIFEADSVTDAGKASAGARPGSGGAYVPLSTREQEEWAVADEEERKILFGIKLKRYKERIKNELDLS